MKAAIGWKVLHDDGTPFHGGTGRWPMPTKNADGSWTPGEWLTAPGPLDLCQPGTLHLCRSTRDVLEWLGPAIFHAEYDADAAKRGNHKIGVLRARLLAKNEHWNERTARLFAADCAANVLHFANDPRCDAAVIAARRDAFGLLDKAARAAARDAAWDAAWDAARDAAWDAARDAARAAASYWQTKRLHAYLTGAVDLDAIRRSVA